MMQELQTKGASQTPSEGTVTGRSFVVLFTLSASDSVGEKSLRGRLGMRAGEFDLLIEGLIRRCLVDVVSGLEGHDVTETLRLTIEGEATLLRSLELMCELPENTASYSQTA